MKYPTLALEMTRGQGQALTAFSASPLYLYFWVAIHRVFPGFPGAALLVQMALGVLTCVGIALAAECWLGRRLGLLAGLAGACYLPLVVNDASFVSEGLVLGCGTAALIGLGRLRRRPAAGWALLAGTALGLSGMARPNILLFLPFAVGAVWWGVPGAVRRRLALAVAVLAPALAGPLLITVRNAVVSGQPVLVMSDSGIVLYIGNNELDYGLSYVWPRHEPLLQPLPGEVDPAHRVAREIAERECGRPLGPNEVARFWAREALRFPREHPLEYAALVLRKLRYFWAAVEAHDVQTSFGQEEALRGWPLLRFAWVGPLALAGLCVTVRRWRELVPLYGMVFTYVATGLLFTVVARYRLPMVPACLVFAGLALADLAAVTRQRRWGVLAGRLALVAAAALAVNLEDCHTRGFVLINRATAATLNRANGLANAGDFARARVLYEAALQGRPPLTVAIRARYGMLLVALQAGDQEAAAAWREAALGPRLPEPRLAGIPDTESLRRRVREDPDDAEAWLLLGVRLWDEGRIAEAERAFRRVTWRVPAFATGHLNRAWCLLRLGRTAEARRWAEAARRLQPELLETHALLIEIARIQGRLAELVSEYERLARLYPEISACARALGMAREAARGDAARAPAGTGPGVPSPGDEAP